MGKRIYRSLLGLLCITAFAGCGRAGKTEPAYTAERNTASENAVLPKVELVV